MNFQLKGKALRNNIPGATSILAALIAFSIPLSTSAVTGFAILLVALWVLGGDFSNKFRQMFGNKVSLAVLAYLGLFVVALAWSCNPENGLKVLAAQWKLLLAPLLLTVVRTGKRHLYINAFLAGMTVAVIMTYLAWFGLLHYADVTPEHLTKKTTHVVFNPMLALSIYLVFHYFFAGKIKSGWRWALPVLGGLMIHDMFITEGRTGQLVFFVLLGLFLIQLFSRKLVKGVLLACLVIPLAVVAAYHFSPTFQGRVLLAYEEIARFEADPKTSVGMRIHFVKNSWEIFADNPLIGVGTGCFKDEYTAVNAKNSPTLDATDNPHNQYMLVLATFGIAGLVIFCGIFIAQLHQAWVVKDNWRRVRFAFPLFFLTIMLAESYLAVYETSFLFSVLGAALYANGSGNEGRQNV